MNTAEEELREHQWNEIQLPKLQPEVFSIDATKCQSMEEMGILLNALGMAMTKEYAKENGLEHLLIEE